MKTEFIKSAAKLAIKRSVRITLPLALSFAATACVVVPARQARVVYYDPPPAVVEAPQAGNWVPGHYVYTETGYLWVRGHNVRTAVPAMPAPVQETIVVAPSPAHVYVRGYWGWGGAAWRWHGGRWVVRGKF